MTPRASATRSCRCQGIWTPRWAGLSTSLRDENNNRRTIYSEVSRFQVDEFLQTFDFPNPSLSAERRYTTNVPGQSLYFMNSPFVRRQAELLVKRLMEQTAPEDLVAEDAESGNERSGNGNGDYNGNRDENARRGAGSAGSDPAEGSNISDASVIFRDREMIEAAYPLLYSREVTEAEIAAGLEFLEERRAAFLAEELEQLEDESAKTPRATPTKSMRMRQPQAKTSEAEPETPEAPKASMQAWIQYARALFSVAEFRFVD